jgi:DNA modification methylase
MPASSTRPVGGGKLGHRLAHEVEAPMPVGLAERFVCWYCPPEGVVLDPFCGTGTTLHAAKQHGRRGIGCDVRADQVDLARRRLATVTPALL